MSWGKTGKYYNLFSDTGLILNAKYATFEKTKTVMGETGLTLSGPNGVSRILMQARPKARVTINGREFKPGETVPSGDGGSVHLSSDGMTLTIKTREGYVINKIIKNPGRQGEMEVKVQTPGHGVATDGRLPGGLLGQTFDEDSKARNSQDPQGEGAIEAGYKDYEVIGGIFGDPSPKVSPHASNVYGLHRFMDELGMQASPSLRFPSSNPISLEKINWQEELRQTHLDDLLTQSARQAKFEVYSRNEKINRLNHLLLLALKAGDLSLAMLLFAHLEAKEANEVTRSMVGKLRDMQQKKRQLSDQIMLQKGDAQGVKNTQMIKTDIESLNDDISVLQSFIREIAQNKQQSIEMANGFITQEHQTTMAVVRSFGR